MDLKPGYKQTEVGIIPEDWEVKQLGDLSAVSSGGTPSRLNPQYWDGAIPWITTSEVDFCTITQASQFITRDGLNNSASKLFSAGTLLMALYGQGKTRGKVGILGFNAAINQACAAISLHKDVSSKYIFHFLGSKYEAIRKLSNTGNQENLNGSIVRSIAILYPPKLEQEAIATALSDVDALIESLEQLIVKKREVKQGTMQELLTPKEDWREISLWELANCKKELFDDGDWIEAEHITHEGIRLIQTGNIGIGQFIEKDVKKYIFESSFVSLHCKEIKEGDLLICRLAEPAGRACVFSDIGEEKVVTSVDVTIFRPPESNANRVFLANLFSTDQWFRSVSDMSGGTTHKRISRGALGRLKITIPSVQEQTAIATILSDMDTEITVLETKLEKARQIKQGMMQELLTGKTRLIPTGDTNA